MKNTKIFTALTAIAYMAVCTSAAFAIPHFKATYEDMEVSLPVLTQNIIKMGSPIWIFIGLLFAALVIVKDVFSGEKKLPNWPFVLLLCAIIIALTYGLYLPLNKIINTI